MRLAEDDLKVTGDYERRAEARLSQAEALRAAGKYKESYAVLDELGTRYPGTRAATGTEVARTRIFSEEISNDVLARAEQARKRWSGNDWDTAMAELRPILGRSDLPGEIRKELTAILVEWESALRSAKELGRRAAAIEATNDQPGALAALNRLVALERAVAADLGRLAQGAAARGDSKAAFEAVDQLMVLGREARGAGPREVAAALSVPFTVELDSRQVSLSVQRPGAVPELVRAPEGAPGPWRHVLPWKVLDLVQVTASRTGFTSQTFTLAAAARRVAAQVALVRGPRWRIDLGAVPAGAPWASPAGVLVGTNRATLELVDPQQGVSRPVAFADTVAELSAQPVVFNGRVYVVLDDRVHAVDLGGSPATPASAWRPRSAAS